MATKKQKREAALAKREAFEEERRQTGLKAQETDRERRARKSRQNQAEAKKVNDRHNTILAMHGITHSVEDEESIDLSRGKEVDAAN